MKSIFQGAADLVDLQVPLHFSQLCVPLNEFIIRVLCLNFPPSCSDEGCGLREQNLCVGTKLSGRSRCVAAGSCSPRCDPSDIRFPGRWGCYLLRASPGSRA
ncbi:unnamed protein product [Linum tenue]|uniref:Uncharacterized protein n=1 Tax=Linum tenue TaxID=586396 RepID=A0AAV0H6Y0_9ROSI|nr:unnamed protein product [Linum tenue]